MMHFSDKILFRRSLAGVSAALAIADSKSIRPAFSAAPMVPRDRGRRCLLAVVQLP